jgi:hypothetical protein
VIVEVVGGGKVGVVVVGEGLAVIVDVAVIVISTVVVLG